MTSGIIVETDNGKFVVKRVGCSRPYASFSERFLAERFLELCVEFGWDRVVLKKEKVKLLISTVSPDMFISRTFGKFNVVKFFGKKAFSFGRFESLEDARVHRDLCVERDWDFSCRLCSYVRGKKKLDEKYISMAGDKFLVSKNFGGVNVRFDLCSSLEEARACRDFWVSVGWDWDCVDLS